MLIAHIVFRFDYGGLENGVVNVVNALSGGSIQHAVIAMTEATGFADRLDSDVAVHALGKKAGRDLAAYVRLFRLLRKIQPDIVHTRNFGTMDCAIVAFLARVPVRIHGEHGWDIFDPEGTSRKYRYMRRFLHRFVHRIVAVSEDLKHWLISTVGIPEYKVQQICNGVDITRFQPRKVAKHSYEADIVIGSVTRFSLIKDPLNLVEAFVNIRKLFDGPRLVMIGDGELYEQAVELIHKANLDETACLPGSRDDVPELLRDMDIFVLGSLKEGISNTILEAMACGLPIIASDTGGNRELVEDGVNGVLVPPGDRSALARAIGDYLNDYDRRIRHGRASRERVISRFTMQNMVDKYQLLYEDALGRHRN